MRIPAMSTVLHWPVSGCVPTLLATTLLAGCGMARQTVRAPLPPADSRGPGGPAEQRPPRPMVADADPPVLAEDCRAGMLAVCTELDLRHLEAAGAADASVQTARWFQDDCMQGDVRSCLQVALVLHERGAASTDTRKAVDRLAAVCEGHFQPGCTLAGRLLQEGQVVPRDQGRARAVLEVACEASQPDGCLQLARMPQDPQQAYRRFRRACDLGSTSGCEEGRALVARVGLQVDSQELGRDLERACRSGLGSACVGAAHVAGWQRGAADFLQLGCVAGESVACLELAGALERGLPGHADAPRAQALYDRACSLGDKEACARKRPAVAEDSPR